MKINVLICTIDSGIDKAKGILLPKQKGVSYVVSHQYKNEKYKYIPAELERSDVLVSQQKEVGLSKNRNNALFLATGDIAIIADDDVQFLPDTFSCVRRVFEANPSLDVACFKINTFEKGSEYKNYPKESFTLTPKHFNNVSSIEIVFRIKKIKKHKIVFDQRFGIGSGKMVAGEEVLFLKDCFKHNLNIVYYPLYIVKHPLASTFKKLSPFDRKKNILKGGIDARDYGYWSFFIAFLKTLRLLPLLLWNRVNPFVYFYNRIQGILIILSSKK